MGWFQRHAIKKEARWVAHEILDKLSPKNDNQLLFYKKIRLLGTKLLSEEMVRVLAEDENQTWQELLDAIIRCYVLLTLNFEGDAMSTVDAHIAISKIVDEELTKRGFSSTDVG